MPKLRGGNTCVEYPIPMMKNAQHIKGNETSWEQLMIIYDRLLVSLSMNWSMHKPRASSLNHCRRELSQNPIYFRYQCSIFTLLRANGPFQGLSCTKSWSEVTDTVCNTIEILNQRSTIPEVVRSRTTAQKRRSKLGEKYSRLWVTKSQSHRH